MAVGSHGLVDTTTLAPGDPVNESAGVGKFSVGISDNFTGDFTFPSYASTIAAYGGFRHTGIGNGVGIPNDFEPVINSNSTGPWQTFTAVGAYPYNYGSGQISF